MATDRLAPDEYDLNSIRESRLERDLSREPRSTSTRRSLGWPVALRRVVTDEDRREVLRLNFESAFTKQVGE